MIEKYTAFLDAQPMYQFRRIGNELVLFSSWACPITAGAPLTTGTIIRRLP